MESNKFLKYRVNINKKFKLIDFSGFFGFWFKVKVVYYKVFLLIIKGGK